MLMMIVYNNINNVRKTKIVKLMIFYLLINLLFYLLININKFIIVGEKKLLYFIKIN